VCLYNATPELMVEKERQIRTIATAAESPDLDSEQYPEVFGQET
jgi:hypothetical protein